MSKCDCSIIHEEIIKKVSENMPGDEILYDLSELFKVFGDMTRIKIISALINEKMCVCDIANLLNMTHSSISHQLRILKQARLVKGEKAGKVVYYSLNDHHINELFRTGISHVTHD